MGVEGKIPKEYSLFGQPEIIIMRLNSTGKFALWLVAFVTFLNLLCVGDKKQEEATVLVERGKRFSNLWNTGASAFHLEASVTVYGEKGSDQRKPTGRTGHRQPSGVANYCWGLAPSGGCPGK